MTKGLIMIKILALFILGISFTYANLIPQKSYTTLTAVNGNSVTLQNPLGVNGQSGIIIRTLPTGNFVTSYIMQTSSNKAIIIDKDPIDGKNLATLQEVAKVGDRVIGGFLYDKVVILAPSKAIFEQVQNMLQVKSIDPDIYGSFVKTGGSSYKKFAKLTGIGLIIVVKGKKVKIIDAITNKIIATTNL